MSVCGAGRNKRGNRAAQANFDHLSHRRFIAHFIPGGYPMLATTSLGERSPCLASRILRALFVLGSLNGQCASALRYELFYPELLFY